MAEELPTLSAEPDAVPVGSSRSLTDQAADLQRDKIATMDKVYDDTTSMLDKGTKRLEVQYEKLGREGENLQPWDADAQREKFRTDPIMEFGSLGSVFGILASAFTRAPMTNALNASAAAINAVKDRNDLEYTRANKAWLDNMKLTMDRHKIQHDTYQDAISLLNSNMTAARSKLQVAAARFDDRKVLMLQENGMDKEILELVAARQKIALEMATNMPKIALENAKMADLMPVLKMPDGPEKDQAIRDHQRRWAGKESTPDQLWVEKYIQENPRWTAEDFARDFGEYKNLQRPPEKFNTDAEIIQSLRDEHERTGKPPPTAAEIADAIAKKRTAATSQRVPKPDEAEIIRKRDELIAQGVPPGEAYTQAVQSVRRAAANVPSANRLDNLKSLYDRGKSMVETIDKVDELLSKHGALTGLGGSVTRPMEVVGNWFGNDETDRAQFRRYISELQEWGTRVLNESASRPLSAEEKKMQNIIPGLAAGDTTANVVRAYRELKPLIQTIREQQLKRIEGTWKPDAPGVETKPTTTKPRWQDAPVVEQ